MGTTDRAHAIAAKQEQIVSPGWNDLAPSRRALLVLGIAVSCALLAGLCRTLLALGRWAFTDRISYFSRDIVWMAPLGTLLLFAVPALMLAALAAAAPRFATFRSVIVVLALPAVLSVLILFTPIHDAASLLLAAGMAWRLGGLADRPLAGVQRVASRTAAVLGLAVLALFAGWRGGRPLLERWRDRSLPRADAALPNVLIVVLDAVRAADVSLYGYPRRTTPALERWAASSTVFNWAMAPSSWTLPSHGALFTGRWPGALSGSLRTRIDETYPTLAEILAARGYRTGGFAANPNYTSFESGLARGFQHYDASHPSLREILLSASLSQTRAARSLRDAKTRGEALLALLPPRFYMLPNVEHDLATADLEVGRFLGWQGRSNRPFFAFVNLFDAHAPYVSPLPGRFSNKPGPRDRYDAAIAFLDAQVDGMLAELARRGVLDRTIVVVTSDHGELFGEHGLWFHNNGLFLDELHVPLLIRYPGAVPAGARVDFPVGLRRVAATILELAGIHDGTIPGPTLSMAWRAPESDSGMVRVQMRQAEGMPSFVAASRGPLRGVVERRWHYILEPEGTELLYDYRKDPGERWNLAATPGADTVLPRLRAITAALPRP